MPDWDKRLEEDLKWREAELTSLKHLVGEAEEGIVRHKALLRSLWAMLYAHYEGFCKFALDTYLEVLTELKPRCIDCKDQIVAFSMRGRFRELSRDLSDANCIRFIQGLSTIFNQPIEFDFRFKAKSKTQSNLFPDVLCDNCQWVCLPYDQVEDNTQRLEALVSRRNDIAHGENVPVKNIKEYREHEDAALEVMYALAIAIIDALEQKQYLK
ncbi:hypothetical protein HYR99_25230 [Candidatus Poribacteria bacterium]|nr:hypothetical protein [Candidatus Poribacteria bacterium]